MALSAYLGTGVRMVGLDEIQEIHPLLNLDGIVGGMYCDTDGSVDPTGMDIMLRVTTGGLINPRPWRGRCRVGYSNTGGPPLPRKILLYLKR